MLGLLWLILNPEAFAEAPRWVTKSPAEDGVYKYYVGRGTGISEAEAISLAVEDAKTQAIRDNFGITTRVQSQTYEALDDASAVKRVDEASFTVLIKGFQQMDLFQSDRQYWVLYGYSKREIKDEKKRIASLPKEKLPEYTVFKGKKHKGGVEIIVEPEDTAVFLDGVQYGNGSVKIVNRLAVGSHSLKLSAPGYKDIEEELIIAPETTIKLKKTLMVEAIDDTEEPVQEERKLPTIQYFWNTENHPDLS